MNRFLPCLAFLGVLAPLAAFAAKPAEKPFDATADVVKLLKQLTVKPKDWPQWGGSYHRNNTPDGKNIPIEWNLETGENILWAVPLGSQTYGNPVVANGKVYVGTNNGYGYLNRYPKAVDLGCLLCFDEATGKFLWQASSPKLPAGRVNDWPQQGICSTVYAEDKRVWYVTSRGEVMCLDSEGFHDGTNNGPFLAEANDHADEADIIWRYDLMGTLGVFQHNMCSCSVTCVGDLLFVNTSNGVDDNHLTIPAPKAPSFLCMDRNTGEVLWTDDSPGLNILHGQWSSPMYFEADGQAQIVFGGGDGWIYSFDPKGDGKKAKLLWKFDANPKESFYVLGGRATRNHIIGTPVFYDGNVYVAVGEDPEHGEGQGHLWCIDPTKRGDVSPSLVIDHKTKKEIPHRRLQAYFEYEPLFKWDKKTETQPAMEAIGQGKLTEGLVAEFKKKGVTIPEKFEAKLESETKKKVGGKERITNQTWIVTAKVDGEDKKWKIEIDSNSVRASVRTDEEEIPNKNSAVVWHYDAVDRNGNKKFDFEEIMHRSIGSVAIKNDLCFISDFSGLVHCIDAKQTDENGRPLVYWTKDMFDASWGSVLIVEDKVYAGDEAGDVLIFELSKEMKMLNDFDGQGSGVNIGSAVYSTPVVANDTLFISNKSMMFAIKEGAKLEGGVKPNTAAESGDAE